MMSRKSFALLAMAAVLVVGITLPAPADLVIQSEEWAGTLGPLGSPTEGFTVIAHYIPSGPNVPVSLVFDEAPEPTSTIWFNWAVQGWDTGISEDNKVAYVYGPRLSNNTNDYRDIFSFNLFYKWDTADVVEPSYPVYQDVVIWDGDTMVADYAWRGTPGGTWNDGSDPWDITWREQFDAESPPYENPVPIPEPLTFGIIGLGTLFLRRRRR